MFLSVQSPECVWFPPVSTVPAIRWVFPLSMHDCMHVAVFQSNRWCNIFPVFFFENFSVYFSEIIFVRINKTYKVERFTCYACCCLYAPLPLYHYYCGARIRWRRRRQEHKLRLQFWGHIAVRNRMLVG
jgi:hypothetical protein